MAHIEPAGLPEGAEPDPRPELKLLRLSDRSEGPHWDAFIERGATAIAMALPTLVQLNNYVTRFRKDEDTSSPEAIEAIDFSVRDNGRLENLIDEARKLPLTALEDGKMPAVPHLNKNQRQSLVELLYGFDEVLLCNLGLLTSKPFRDFVRLTEPKGTCSLPLVAANAVAASLDMLRDLQVTYKEFVP